jgi:hypothetical protein
MSSKSKKLVSPLSSYFGLIVMFLFILFMLEVMSSASILVESRIIRMSST